MDSKGKLRTRSSKNSSGFFKSFHRLPTKFVKDCGFIPVVLIHTASVVEKYIKTKEIFQTQGAPSRAYSTLNQLSNGRLWRSSRHVTVHDAVEAIKLVLVSLPEQLIPDDVCDALITASRENSADQYGKILAKFRMKSPLNFGILHFMMVLLRKVSLHAQHNLMDVRKLATIFVLDVIKPLKLDDPNDGEFLSERMQRLPYLIMVVEKLILHVDIFKTARAKKATNSAATENSSQGGAGCVDTGSSVGDRRESGQPKAPPRVSVSASTASQLLSAGRLHTGNPGGTSSPSASLTISKSARLSVSTISTGHIRGPQASASRGQSPTHPKHLHLMSPRCVSSSTNPNAWHKSHSGSASRVPLQSSHPGAPVACSPNSNPRLPQWRSRSSSTMLRRSRNKMSHPPCHVTWSSSGNTTVHKAKVTPTLHICKAGAYSLNQTTTNGSVQTDQGAPQHKEEKRPGQGRRVRGKADSLPPTARTGTDTTAAAKRDRAASCTARVERRATSPRKKRPPPARGKVGSFREGEKKRTRPSPEKRRCVSAGSLGADGSATSSLGRRKRKWSAGKKKSGQPETVPTTPVLSFSRGSDRIAFMLDEVMSPWVDEDATSDDASLMTRTIRNPRILPVSPAGPPSPEASCPPRRKGRNRGRRRSRKCRQSSSVRVDHSPRPRGSPNLEPLQTPSPPRPHPDFRFRAIDPALVSDASSIGDSTLPSVGPDSSPHPHPARNVPQMDSVSISESSAVSNFALNTSASPKSVSAISGFGCGKHGEKYAPQDLCDSRSVRGAGSHCDSWSVRGTGSRSHESPRCETSKSHRKKSEASGLEGAEGLTSQATARDGVSLSCSDQLPQSPTPASDQCPRERASCTGPPEDAETPSHSHLEEQQSRELASVSTSPVSWRVSGRRSSSSLSQRYRQRLAARHLALPVYRSLVRQQLGSMRLHHQLRRQRDRHQAAGDRGPSGGWFSLRRVYCKLWLVALTLGVSLAALFWYQEGNTPAALA